jgi:hypothetical protein
MEDTKIISERQVQLEKTVLELESIESSDKTTKKRLQETIANLTRKRGKYVFDVRQQIYVKPTSLKEELRLSINRCHMFGDDNEALYPLDLIRKMAKRGTLKDVNLRELIESGGVSSQDFSRIVGQLNIYVQANSIEFRNNKTALLAATVFFNYKELYKRLNSNKRYVLSAIEEKNLCAGKKSLLSIVSEALQADKDVVLAAVNHYGLALEYASEALQADKDVVRVAAKQNGLALNYASSAIKKDDEMIFYYGFMWRSGVSFATFEERGFGNALKKSSL